MFHSDHQEEDIHAYKTKLEQKVGEILSPLQEFIRGQSIASFFLIFSTCIALIWASLPKISDSYHAFVNAPLGLFLGPLVIKESLRFWINDILLTLFFFYVGLEIKREFLIGELANKKKALFILFAAIGGMVVPAIIYALFNYGTDSALGWGVPMATDTAFALGIASIFKSRLPKSIFTFLAALAILDDIGAIVIIAIFYTKNLHVEMFFISSVLVLILILINYMGVRKATPYLILGLLIWGSVHAAGIHGTISGIIVALIVPARPEHGPRHFMRRTNDLIKEFESKKERKPLILEDDKQHAVLEEIQEVAQQSTTPLQRWESRLDLPIALFILPLFALVNAGIPLKLNALIDAIQNPVAVGVFLGLFIGKPLGISIFGKLASLFDVGELPNKTRFNHIIGASFLAGIGFTMSLFIANLSFENDAILYAAKLAILLASLLSGTLGILYLVFSHKLNTT